MSSSLINGLEEVLEFYVRPDIILRLIPLFNFIMLLGRVHNLPRGGAMVIFNF